MNFKETIFAADMFPNLMERDYGKGIVLAQQDDENGQVLPYSVFSFGKNDWNWLDDYYPNHFGYETLEEAESKVSELLA